jgi:isoprenylcysteine carboxyl methyltransferase (ICMT) family protein YpbQ
MLNFIFPVSFIMFAIFFLILSKSKKNYQKLVDSNGEKFATQISKYLNIGGYFLLIFSSIWSLFLLIID